MPATTAQAIVSNAFDDLGIYAPGQSISNADAQGAFRRLNLLMGSLSLQSLTKPVQTRYVTPIVSGQGGPSNPYTIGPGGNFNTTRPTALTGAAILLNAGTPSVATETPRDVLTDEAWQSIRIKELLSTQFTSVYYDQTFSNDLGTIYLYPVPTDTTNQLVLYWRELLTTFANLTTQYFLPPGCEEALEWGLARVLMTPYGIKDAEIVSDVKEMARTTMANFKRANVRLSDLTTDPAITHDRRAGYNILTGEGG